MNIEQLQDKLKAISLIRKQKIVIEGWDYIGFRYENKNYIVSYCKLTQYGLKVTEVYIREEWVDTKEV